MSNPGYAIFLNGAYGVGKSSTLDHCGSLLAEAGKPFTLMDVDWFHRSWPPGADDPDNVILEAANMSAVWANYSTAGPRQLIISGVIASSADRARYEQVFALPLRLVRLAAGSDVIEARLRHRYSADQIQELTWHLDRHVALADHLTRVDLDELVIQTDDRSPRDIARQVLSFVGVL